MTHEVHEEYIDYFLGKPLVPFVSLVVSSYNRQ